MRLIDADKLRYEVEHSTESAEAFLQMIDRQHTYSNEGRKLIDAETLDEALRLRLEAYMAEGKVREADGIRISRLTLQSAWPVTTELHTTVAYTEFEKTQRAVESWSKERGIDKADPAKQMLKLAEEVGELAAAIARNNELGAMDAVGDVMVVLTILCQQIGISLIDSYAIAYETIKNRKGKTVNGVFVKEADLNGD
jgi:NTP pyrophosphatase (non-canonical NTP hydrolase)